MAQAAILTGLRKILWIFLELWKVVPNRRLGNWVVGLLGFFLIAQNPKNLTA